MKTLLLTFAALALASCATDPVQYGDGFEDRASKLAPAAQVVAVLYRPIFYVSAGIAALGFGYLIGKGGDQ